MSKHEKCWFFCGTSWRHHWNIMGIMFESSNQPFTLKLRKTTPHKKWSTSIIHSEAPFLGSVLILRITNIF